MASMLRPYADEHKGTYGPDDARPTALKVEIYGLSDALNGNRTR